MTVAASGVLSNDVAGADGATAGGGRLLGFGGGRRPDDGVTTGVGTSIAGLHGTLHSAGERQLHLSVDGERTCTADTTDVFVYTVKDGDGDTVDDDADDQS